MTDPSGKVFLSYRRSRLDEARCLVAALHDLGVPTWQDVDDLAEAPTEAELRRVLGEAEIGGGLLWLTPEVADSAMIRQVEVPLLLDRARRGDSFFVVPALAGGLDYAGAAAALDPAASLEDLRRWKLRKLERQPLGTEDARQVARWVLERRIAALHEHLPVGAPLRLVLDTRPAPAWTSGTALLLDWTARFQAREATPAAWTTHLLPALADAAATVERLAPGRPIQATGKAAIPAAVALGATFLAPRGIQIAWQQPDEKVGPSLWSLGAPSQPSGFRIETRPDDLAAKDLAVLVSVADSVDRAFGACRTELPPFRAIVRVFMPDPETGRPARYELKNPGEATDIAFRLRDAIRAARAEYGKDGTAHLFLAVPPGLAMLIGQLLNTLSAAQTYEFVPQGDTGRYRAAALLHPSS